MASLLIWSSVTAVESYAAGTAEVQDGVLTLRFDDAVKAEKVEVGMNIKVGELVAPVMSIGFDEAGAPIAIADVELPDGSYDARVGYRSTQVIRMLFA